jgi:hypothetical protein
MAQACLNHLLPITIASPDGAEDLSARISGNLTLAINPCPAKRRRVDALQKEVRTGNDYPWKSVPFFRVVRVFRGLIILLFFAAWRLCERKIG